MSKVLYLTNDVINASSSGSTIVYHESAALKKVFNEVIVMDRLTLLPTYYVGLDIPFLTDYFAISHIEEIKPDMVHIYSGCFSESVRYCRDHNIKVTYTCPAHDIDLSIKEFQKQIGNYPYVHIGDKKLWSQFSLGLRLADIVIVPSSYSQKFLVREKVKEGNIRVIPHGCDIPENVLPLPTEFNVGYLGQVGPDKGLSYLIEAWGYLNSFYRTLFENDKLILAGSGTEQLSTSITKLANNGQFVLLGRTSNIDDFFSKIRVFVQPSVTESFGMTIIEAMSRGRAVIASNCAGASEALYPNHMTGYIYDSAESATDGSLYPDVESGQISYRAFMIAGYIKALKDRAGFVEDMGRLSRERSLDYSWSKIEEKYIKLWSNIV